MENSWYSFDVSPTWVFLALLLAVVAAVLLYSKKSTPWSKPMNILMGFLRFAAFFLITLLLLNPILQLFVNTEEQPIIIMAVDDSESITARSSSPQPADINAFIHSVGQNLSDQYQINHIQLSGRNSDTITFSSKTTNLSELMNSVTNIYEDQNVGAVVLLSDGVINQGQSISYQPFKFPVYSVGLGDTIPPKDIAIQSIRANKVAYQGNKFPVYITLSQKGFRNEQIEVSITESGKRLAQQEVTLDNEIIGLNFLLESDKAGLRRLNVSVSQKEGESTYANNSQQVYIDVIEGKDKVLIIAPAPHPDINAIRSVLNQTANYETTLYIPGIYPKPKDTKFDVIIEHQAFSGTRYGDFESTGQWFIMGNRTNLRLMTGQINYLGINVKGGKDMVKSSLNADFSKFKLDPDLSNRLDDYPPIQVPFGEYQLAGPVENLFYQQVGSITTTKPLMCFFDDGTQKSALLTGSGIWQWKLQEAGSEENIELFKSVVLKTVQYLSIKVNKNKFAAKPRETNYQIGDRVFIDTETYNDIYERSYGHTIKLTLTDENGRQTNYEMVDSQVNSSFNLGSLPAGVYQYKAQTEVEGKTYSQSGSFVIKDIQLENINLTADHHLLQSVSKNSGGKYYPFDKSSNLISDLESASFKNIIHTAKQDFPLINSIWVIVLIGIFLGAEWFLRKFLGAY